MRGGVYAGGCCSYAGWISDVTGNGSLEGGKLLDRFLFQNVDEGAILLGFAAPNSLHHQS